MPAPALPAANIKTEKHQKFLDGNQYSKNGITRYEEIFGKTWVSVGGETTTKEFVELLDLKPGMKVLDIGSGAGGSAFLMARNYGVDVHGIDLSSNMNSISLDYRQQMEAQVDLYKLISYFLAFTLFYKGET